MKRIAKITSFALVVIMIFTLFTGCAKIDQLSLSVLKEEKRTPKILEILDKTVKKADSYTLTSTGVVSTSILGVGLTMKTTIDEVIEGKNSDNPIKTATINNEYKYSEESLDFSIERLDGYRDGYLYYGVTHEEYESKLKSAATLEEFEAHNREMSTITSLVGIPTENATSEKADDGSWIVYIKDVDGELYKNISGDLGAIIPGYRIKSLDMTVKVKSDFSEWENEMSFNFEPIEDYDFTAYGFYVPVAVYTAKISAINSSVAEQVDLSKYTECADIDIITTFLTDLTKLLERESGKISVGINHNINLGGKKYEISEYDEIEYGTTDDKFHYNINIKADGKNYTMKYSNGNRIDIYNKTINSDDITEKAFVSGLITGNLYEFLAVKDVRMHEDTPNTYVIEMYMTDEILSLLTVMDVEMTQGTLRFEISYVNGEIGVVKCFVDSSAPGVSGGASYDIEIITIVLEGGSYN